MSFPLTHRIIPVTATLDRPVDPQWTCQRSGECCTKPAEVVMTREESIAIGRHLLDRGLSSIRTQWREFDEGGRRFMALKARPCPFYIFKSCVVYEARPFNCRRFACMRPDPTTELYEEDPHDRALPRNATIRIQQSRAARRRYEKILRKAMQWARKHGWSDS